MGLLGETLLSIPVDEMPKPCCWNYLIDWQSVGESQRLKCICGNMFKSKRVEKSLIVTPEVRDVEIALSKKCAYFTTRADAERWMRGNVLSENAVMKESEYAWVIKILPWDWVEQGSAKIVKQSPGVLVLKAQQIQDTVNTSPTRQQLEESDSRQWVDRPRTVIE